MKSIVPTPMLGSALSVMVCGLLACAAGEARADTDLPLIGGRGGAAFHGGCPPDQNLGGFELRVGDYIDAIRPVCVISLGPQEVRLGPVQPPFFGGPGGGNRWLVCPQHKPIVIGVSVVGSGKEFITVSAITLYCGQAISWQTAEESASYRSPSHPASDATGIVHVTPIRSTAVTQFCQSGRVAIGVHGRSGTWLDSMGLMCDVPRLPGNRAVAQGPTAASPPPVKKLGRVEAPFSSSQPPRPICDVANEARARNNSAAPGLEAQCRAELAIRGEAIANRDPLSAELRRRTRNDLSRRGFDIGMAAAEGDTAPGPGKQAIHNALAGVEQAAFDAAVSFSLQRNKNAQLAATGAAIAQADSAVAQARTADNDVFFWLGFDIATGIFGDPTRGALGNTATGRVSLAIRDALDPAAQRGFNASTQLHLSRNGAKGNLGGSVAGSPVNGGKPAPLSAVAPLSAAAPRLQKADAISLNPQPLPPKTTVLPAQAPSALR